MVSNDKTILTAHPSKKHGIIIDHELYNMLSEFILRNLQHGDFVTSLDLLVGAESNFRSVQNLHWYLMHVKLDLEARGFIQMAEHAALRTKFLKITASGIKELAQKSSWNGQ